MSNLAAVLPPYWANGQGEKPHCHALLVLAPYSRVSKKQLLSPEVLFEESYGRSCIRPYKKIGAQCLFFSRPLAAWGITETWAEAYLNYYDATAMCRKHSGDLAEKVFAILLTIFSLCLAISHGFPQSRNALSSSKLGASDQELNHEPIHVLEKRSPVSPHRGHRLQSSAALRANRPRRIRARIVRQRKFNEAGNQIG
eukprot:maker-scaffold547_size140190-snap-gene-0.28 protein:Tk03231 transcript:maker-scaffold547_size140190-snap-gene-0.28-mRNA-1 annotation:"mfs-type transporter c6orf192"